jgi:RNA polymerase sigma factor (sigma-70 family)
MSPEIFIHPMGSHEQFRAIRANDQKALQLLYRNNYPKVEKYVVDNNGTKDEARDVYQEAFIATWRNIQLDKFKADDPSALPGYIFRIAKNKWIDQLRSKKSKPTLSLEEDQVYGIADDGVPDENKDYIDAVKEEYMSLGQKCRDLLNRFYFQKESLREIAVFFNWTEPSAKNNKYRCLEELRKLVRQKIQKNFL